MKFQMIRSEAPSHVVHDARAPVQVVSYQGHKATVRMLLEKGQFSDAQVVLALRLNPPP